MESLVAFPWNRWSPCSGFRMVLRATPSVRPISRALTPSRASRSICRICRMVSSLLAGIPDSSVIEEPGCLRGLTRGETLQVAGD